MIHWICVLLMLLVLSPTPTVAAGRPPPKKRDSTVVRRLALRPEEKAAREAAITRLEAWLEVAAPRRRLEELTRSDVPTLCGLLEEFYYQSYVARWPIGSLRHLLTGVVDRYFPQNTNLVPSHAITGPPFCTCKNDPS